MNCRTNVNLKIRVRKKWMNLKYHKQYYKHINSRYTDIKKDHNTQNVRL
jgi:hypothetical protein